MPRLTITNDTRASIPRAPFRAIKEAALSKTYSLDLVFTTPAEMRKLNKIYRGKDGSTDILSFPLSKSEGEIYISPADARRQAKDFDRSYPNFIVFLFIHGCAHLKGHDHGATMERVEARLRKIFKI